MNILQVLVLQLLAVPTFTLTQPVQDYWGEFGAYGPCSRTCGIGIAMRTRTCITSRTDGGHNCVGSSRSFRTCNTHACPVGSRDFREEQCSEFDRMNFQGKIHSWVPYYGAPNPCELNCVPRGQNFFYRHRPTVVDGTPCYVGRTDICVDGVCRLLTHGEFMGLDNDTSPAPSIRVTPHPRETFTYIYRTGVYAECSATCDGGMQYRSVECVVQDPSNPRVVDESYCITQRLQRPPSQQACNMHQCVTEYSVSSFSECSVTCGEGQQTREVMCVGSRGEHLPDHACRGLARPASVQTCRRPACHTHITWHVTGYGLCSRSCDGGMRERMVGCFDIDLNSYPEERCGLASRPTTMERCNSQPCHRRQTVPSVQDPGASGSTGGFVPHVSGEGQAPHCAESSYGCCPDGRTPATGPRYQGCSRDDCVRTRYGCCLDGVTPARGYGRAGCPDYQTTSVTHGGIAGVDYDTNSVHSRVDPRETHTYIFQTGVYSECSVTCDGGVQYRSVECVIRDPSPSRVVDDSYCIAQRLQRPPSQQACNMHPCAAEYSVSSFSVCSVTCGEGQQTREVVCVGPRGEHLPDHACRGLTRPPSVQTCRRPACHTHITWHVTEYGLCSRSCDGGVRERQVGCFDTDLNPYPEDQCGLATRPTAVESCNSQPCNRVQMVPSVQDPGSGRSTMRGFVPHVHEASRPDTHSGRGSYPPVTGPHCAQSPYGCCPDGYTSATGPRNQGCPLHDCSRSRYGCCLDEVTPAQGAGRAGCPEYQTTNHYRPDLAGPSTEVCSLPRDEGPCDTWVVRFAYDSGAGKCMEFWYGGCHGNGNNFVTIDGCQRECGGVRAEPPTTPRRATPSRGSYSGTARARAHRSRVLQRG